MISLRFPVSCALVLALALPQAAMAQAPGGAAPPPPAVTVQTIEPRSIPITYEYAGRVVASREVEVRARVGGILLERSFEEGEQVRPDQVLFRIDPREFEAQVALNEAQVQQAQATLGQARRTEERQRELTQRGAASAATLDDATSSRELAEAQVAAAEAQLLTARLSLDYATVTAPVGGITSLEQVPEGSLLSVNTLMTRISQLDPIYINFSAADTEAIQIRRLIESGAAEGGLADISVEVSFGDGTVYGDKGTIDFTSSSIDTTTGTILSRAVLPNKDQQLLPGQFVRVRVDGLTLDNAIEIPAEALMQNPQGQYVFTVDEAGLAQVRPIRIGREGERTVIVADGLKAGDRVITEGVVKVRPAAPVNISAEAPTPTDGDAAELPPREAPATSLPAADGDEASGAPAPAAAPPAAATQTGADASEALAPASAGPALSSDADEDAGGDAPAENASGDAQ